MTSGTSPAAHDARRRWLLVGAALLAVLALLVLLHSTHLLMPTFEDPTGDDPLGDLTDAIKSVKTPAIAVFSGLSGLGLLAGGAMTAMGMPQGMRMMVTSGLAWGGVMLGNGIVA
jgi:hypothetical protein